MSFQIVIVTPEQQVLDQAVTQAILPAHDGQIGILTGRAPLLVKLGQGRLQIDPAKADARPLHFYVEGGIAQMKENKLTVLTQMAIPAGDISPDTARAELAEATARQTTDARAAEDRARQLKRARTMLAMTADKSDK